MKRRLFLVAIACAAIVSLYAQVITWAVKPGVYSTIEPCWGDMYFAYKGNNIGVINGDGTIIVSPEATRITGFFEGRALVLKSDGGQERVMGILSTDGVYAKVNGTYYTIPNQEFFSEGFLTVKTPRGGVGYMNTNGIVDKEYDVSFASPFSEGYAVVGEGGESHKFSIVDKRFNELQLSLPSMSPLWNGANVFKGVAIVWDGNGNIFEFSPQRGGPCTAVKDKSIKKMLKDCNYIPDYDYLGGLAKLTNRPETAPYNQPIRSSLTLAVSGQGNRYGYVSNGKVILPFQFEQAESFFGNYAVVRYDAKYAILSLQNSGEGFNAVATNPNIKYKKNESTNIAHTFGITVPTKWNPNDINITIKDENGILKNVTNKNGNFEFVSDGSVGSKNYVVEMETEGLKLWKGELTYNYEQRKEETLPPPPPPSGVKEFTVSLKVNNSQADKNNHCIVTATVYNPNPADISALVTFSGSNLLEAISKRITVPGRGSRDISTYFTVKKAISGQKVTVTTSAGGKATLDGLQLIPF